MMKNLQVAKEQLDYLKSFQQQLISSRKIDKSSVISLEQFIGENMVSSKININKLSNTPRDMMVDEVVSAVDVKIKDLEQEVTPFSLDDAVTILLDTVHATLPNMRGIVIRFLERKASNVPTEPMISKPESEAKIERFIAAVNNDKIKYRYDAENNLIDISTLPLDIVITKYQDYLFDIYAEVFKVNKDPNCFISVDQTGELSSTNLYVNALLNLVKVINDSSTLESYRKHPQEMIGYLESASSQYPPKQITMQDLVIIASNAIVLEQFLLSVYNVLVMDVADKVNTETWPLPSIAFLEKLSRKDVNDVVDTCITNMLTNDETFQC